MKVALRSVEKLTATQDALDRTVEAYNGWRIEPRHSDKWNCTY